ncbi:OB-fold nucleic acid binding domain-containing protein [Roseovarius tibetensis]|uniref:OB-fold nucleic acid binding domain-containing protein n=1 Tax=Roseovarius tibetensis TaxID=2685897 RepID=UPI003D7FA77A
MTTHLPHPPSAVVATQLAASSAGARVTVAGLVLLRQRPGTAQGVVFVTLEDETGVVNVVIWRNVFETFRRAVVSGRLLRVTGRVERQAGVIHVVAELIEDISGLLDQLGDPDSGLSQPAGAG